MITLVESYGDGLIGLWLYTGDKIIGESIPVDDGFVFSSYVQFDSSKNHLSEWIKVVTDNFEEPEASAIISKGYKHFERGRVIFNLLTLSYTVICSKNLKSDVNFRNKVLDYFNLRGKRVDFEALDHYYAYTKTGNPALDDFECI